MLEAFRAANPRIEARSNRSKRSTAALTNYCRPFQTFQSFNRCAPFQSFAGFNNMADFDVSGILETSK